MSIFVYRRADSTGAGELSEALPGGRRWKDVTKPIGEKAAATDRVIAWGDYAQGLRTGVLSLNNVPLTNKLQEAIKLRDSGVSTIEISETAPQDVVRTIPGGPDPAVELWNEAATLAEDFANMEVGTRLNRSRVTVDAVNGFTATLARLQAALAAPPPADRVERTTATGWLPRDRNHVGGLDLLNPPTTPHYWVKKIDDIVEEYRIHSFLGKSISAGIKDVRIDDAWTRSGKTPHEWVRGWEGGWRIRYSDFEPRQAVRDIAHAAVKALGLDFGAVDIGKRRDGTLVVFEVNRAPGVEGQTVNKYASAIERWMNGTFVREE